MVQVDDLHVRVRRASPGRLLAVSSSQQPRRRAAIADAEGAAPPAGIRWPPAPPAAERPVPSAA